MSKNRTPNIPQPNTTDEPSVLETNSETLITCQSNGIPNLDVENERRNLCKVAREWLTFENECHRKNFIQTCCVYFNFVLLGWTYGQLGTAFPEFQLILNTSVKQTSLVFTVNSIGYMVGSLGFGFIYDRVSRLKLLGSLSIINGFTSIVLPWCKWFGLFLFVRLLDGFLCGGRDGGGNAKVASCWGTEGRQFMQGLHFTYALGGIISPLVTSLFLAPRIHPQSENTTGLKFTLDDVNVTGNLSDTGSDDDVVYGKTHVHIAFAITGLLTACSGVLYIFLYWKGYEKVPSYSNAKIERERKQSSSDVIEILRVQMTRLHKTIFIIILGICVIVYSTVECKYQSFLMPFVLLHMKWTKSKGAFLISLLWAFYGIGRFSGIFISRIIPPTYLLVSFLTMLAFSSCVLCIGSYFLIDAIVWIMVPVAGFSISVIFPTFIVWTQENALKISGKIGGFFLFVGALGFFIDPLYIGYLMEQFSPMYFNYLNIAEASSALIICLLLLSWIRVLRKKQIQTQNQESNNLKELGV